MLTEQQADYWTRRLPRTYANKQPCDHDRVKIKINVRLIERAINAAERANPSKGKGDLAIEKAAKHFGYTKEALMQPLRSKNIVRARNLAMYVYKNMVGANLTQTGQRFGKDRTTVNHAIKKIEKSPPLKKLADDIIAHVLWLK